MSLGLIIKAPEGIVLAAESRVTLSVNTGKEMIHVNFDNASKVLTFNRPYGQIGAVTYGQAAIGNIRTAHSFIAEFETMLEQTNKNKNLLTVLEFATELSNFFMTQWASIMPPDYQGPNMIFNVAGFDKNEPYGKVYTFEIPKLPNPVEQSGMVNGQHQFGISWGGQREIIDRLIQGYDSRIFQIFKDVQLTDDQINALVARMRTTLNLPIPIQFMPLQDCVDLALLFIRTTINAQSLTVGLRGCGGAIDVAVITKNNPLTFIQKKQISGESKN